MGTKDIRTKLDQTKKVEDLYWDTKHWKSMLKFMEDEIIFMERLLSSYIFEPNTPNLFERLQDYQKRLVIAKTEKGQVRINISKHENDLAGMMECTDSSCDSAYYQKHDRLKAEVVSCTEHFQILKSEIFNYAGGILKKRKPEPK